MAFSKRDKRIAEKLADPDVDQDFARKHIEKSLAEIQARWTDNERNSRNCYLPAPVETPVIEQLSFLVGRNNEVTR